MTSRGVRGKEYQEAFIKDMRTYLEPRYAARNTRINEIWRRRKNAWGAPAAQGGRWPELPGNFKDQITAFQAPFIGDVIRRAQAIIAAKLPKAEVIPGLGHGVEAQANADHRELWFNQGAYPKMQEREDTYAMLTDAMANDGECVAKLLHQPHTWVVQRSRGESDEEYNRRSVNRRRSTFPFVLDHVDTRTYFPFDPDEDGLSEVLEVTKRSKRMVIDRYSDRDTDLSGIGEVVGDGYGSEVEFMEYWNRTHFQYFVDGKLVRTGKHRYERPPYYHAAFSTTSHKDPSYATEAIAAPLMMLQDKIENFMTAQEAVIWKGGFAGMRLRPLNEDAIPPDTSGAKIPITITPGGIIEGVPFGHILEWMPPPDLGANASKYQDILMDFLDRVSLAPILYAQMQGDPSGPVATSLIALARAIFGPGLTNLARMYDQIAMQMQYMIEKVIKDDVPVWIDVDRKKNKLVADWLTLGPKDIKGYYAVKHSLDPIIPMEQWQNAIMMSTGWRDGLLSRRRVIEEGYRISAPQMEIEDRMAEDIETGPEAKSQIMEEVKRRLLLKQPPPPSQISSPAMAAGPGGGPVPQMVGEQGLLPGMVDTLGVPGNGLVPAPEVGPPIPTGFPLA